MMRLTPGALQLLAFSLRASAATASAEGVWVLWKHMESGSGPPPMFG